MILRVANYVDATFIELHKAFDCVPSHTLTEKFQYFKFDKLVCKLLKTYFQIKSSMSI